MEEGTRRKAIAARGRSSIDTGRESGRLQVPRCHAGRRGVREMRSAALHERITARSP